VAQVKPLALASRIEIHIWRFFGPGCAVKYGRGVNPNMPAIKFVGKLRTCVL